MNTSTTDHQMGHLRHGPLYTATWQALQPVWAAPKPSDSVLTARIVGEFSAGKSRLLRELLAPATPPALLPISSREVQTRLMLEVTYSPEPELLLVQKARDTDIQADKLRTLQTLTAFPDRDAMAGIDPLQHRLRLGVPLPSLFLPDGDRFEAGHQPKRMFLIDTPGWNSGQDTLAELPAEQLLTGYMNLALVYVCSVTRVDHALSMARLKDFLRACTQTDFLDTVRLQAIVTSCPQAEAERTQNRLRQAIHALWQELGESPEQLQLQVLAIDFEEDSPSQSKAERVEQFRQTFWDFMLAPLQANSQADSQADGQAASQAMGRTPRLPDYDFAAAMAQCQDLLAQAHRALLQARPATGFACGQTSTHFMGLDADEARERLQARWAAETGTTLASLQTVCQPELPSPPEDHPLYAWWQHHTLAQVRHDQALASQCVEQLHATLTRFNPAQAGLATWFEQQLRPLHQAACRALDPAHSHTAHWLAHAPSYLDERSPEHKASAAQRLQTVLALSLLQARYVDAGQAPSDGLPSAATSFSETPDSETTMDAHRFFASAEQQAVIFHYMDLLAQRTRHLEERLQRGEADQLRQELDQLRADKTRARALSAAAIVSMLPVIFKAFWSAVPPADLCFVLDDLHEPPNVKPPYEEPSDSVRQVIRKRISELHADQRQQLAQTCRELHNSYRLIYREGFQKMLAEPAVELSVVVSAQTPPSPEPFRVEARGAYQ